MRPYCVRCLLAQMPDASELKKNIDELIEQIPENKKTRDEIYKDRLDICSSCPELISGTCGQCGCYVELRAASAAMDCPLKKW